MLTYVYLYHYYHSTVARILRVIIILVLSIWLILNFDLTKSIAIPLFFLSLYLQLEVFFHFKISKVTPKLKAQDNKGEDSILSCTKEALEKCIAYKSSSQIIASLLNTPQGEFLLQKLPAEPKEIKLIEISNKDLLSSAFKLVRHIGGTFIISVDLLAVYLLLTEEQTKLLFNKQIKQEEFLEILAWTRQMFKNEEFPAKRRVHLYGGGFGEGLTTGWTLETKKYTSNYTWNAFRMKPQITGREKEFNTMLQALSKTENNNILLVGDPGSGKENLVALLATESYGHNVSTKFPHIKILELMIGPLIAGAANRAELETRLQAIIDEVSHAGNVILYIPELQNITGSSSYEVDLSGALLPYLKSGKIPIVASVSFGNFKSYLEKSPLLEAFTVIKLEEPDRASAMRMLLQKASELEDKYNVVLTYKAIATAVEYADRFFQDAVLPGSAISILEDVAHKLSSTQKHTSMFFGAPIVYVLAEHITNAIQEKTHIAVGQPTGQEKDLLLHLEEKMHERVIDQQDAIKAIAESMRRLRAGLESLKRPISFLFMGPTGVGKTETAKALAQIYFGGEDKMIRLDMSEYSDEQGIKRLLGAPPGEGEERGELTDKIADHPFSLVLLDEFEKANPKILNLFLQVLEDGRLTDNKGKTVNFVNSIIIATSNAGAEFIREEINKGTVVDKEFSHRLLDQLQKEHLFRPELLNRFDEIIIFKPLGEREMQQIAKLILDDIIKRLYEQDIILSYDEKLLAKIVKEGFDQQFGARPLRRYIQDSIEDIIAQKKLRDEIVRGNKVFATTDDSGNIVVNIS